MSSRRGRCRVSHPVRLVVRVRSKPARCGVRAARRLAGREHGAVRCSPLVARFGSDIRHHARRGSRRYRRGNELGGCVGVSTRRGTGRHAAAWRERSRERRRQQRQQRWSVLRGRPWLHGWLRREQGRAHPAGAAATDPSSVAAAAAAAQVEPQRAAGAVSALTGAVSALTGAGPAAAPAPAVRATHPGGARGCRAGRNRARRDSPGRRARHRPRHRWLERGHHRGPGAGSPRHHLARAHPSVG